MIQNQQKIEQIAGVGLICAIIAGCFFVLWPFALEILWAAILCFATWPLNELLLKLVKGRRNLAAGLMTFILLLVLLIPFCIVGLTLTDSVRSLMEWLNSHPDLKLPPPPGWVAHIPLAGDRINEYWTRLTEDAGPAVSWLKPWFQKAGLWLLQHSLDFARGVLHLAMSVLIAFFLYRDGEGFAGYLREGFQKISGDFSQHLLDVVKATVKSVVYGVIGASIAQGIAAGIGFVIVGVPSPMLLAMFTFFLSFIPFGAVLIWLGASVWLFGNDRVGMGIFMLIWGFVVISNIDHLIKPYVISRGSKLPYIVMFIGVLGGIITFGFIGVFLGPTLLAVGYSLTQEIISHRHYGYAIQAEGEAKNPVSLQ
jgi:predicted PurR-regulated permease PerM